jgi:hypothetical protein
MADLAITTAMSCAAPAPRSKPAGECAAGMCLPAPIPSRLHAGGRGQSHGRCPKIGPLMLFAGEAEPQASGST